MGNRKNNSLSDDFKRLVDAAMKDPDHDIHLVLGGEKTQVKLGDDLYNIAALLNRKPPEDDQAPSVPKP